MLKADIIIPPEALEAAAKAIFDASPFREGEAPFGEQSAQYQALTRAYARAACLALLKAWPGFEYRADVAFPAFGYGPNGIVLPLLNEESE